MNKSTKTRLDVALVERGLADTRAKAQALILAGEVTVNQQAARKAGTLVGPGDVVMLKSLGTRYVSRGGLKLEGALADLGLSPQGKICADVGSSTGGFTDCLLQHGALRVYAIDVSPEQLDWKLRKNQRVVQIRCNARNLRRELLPESPELVTVDLSFISTAKVIAALASIAGGPAAFLILVKPQFELARGDVGRGGIVRDTSLHERAVERVKTAAIASGLQVKGVAPSRITGAEGNQEYFVYALK